MKRLGLVPLLRVCVVGCALVASACSDSSPSSPDAALPRSPDAAVVEVADGGSLCISKPLSSSTADISGTWAARVTGAIVVNAPIIGVVHQQMVLTLLVHITQQGTDLIADGRYCNRKQKSEPGALTQVVIPDAWAHTETPIHRQGSYAVGADGGGPVLVMPMFAETMGAVLASPATDTLPTVATDTRVIDQDNDGHPGITVYISGLASGTLYAVQRQVTAFTAVPSAADRLEGTVQFSTEQNVLGSDPATLAILYAQAGQSGADPTVASTITMVKLADAAVSCECVRANDTTLFGP